MAKFGVYDRKHEEVPKRPKPKTRRAQRRWADVGNSSMTDVKKPAFWYGKSYRPENCR